jgi:hypothetical protein
MWADNWTVTPPHGPLSNIALTWMLGEAEAAGLALPHLWRTRYITDASAPASGTTRGAGKWFVARHARRWARPSERVHPSARAAATRRGITLPLATPA